jgi:prevent-host-death family protein
MLQIRPISDLRNNFADISRIVHESSEPVFLTKNGYGDMVVMSVELYEKLGIAAILQAQKPQTAGPEAQAAPKNDPPVDFKIQKPLSKWKKTLSEMVSK